MTVQQLIEKLQKYPQHFDVQVVDEDGIVSRPVAFYTRDRIGDSDDVLYIDVE